MNRTAIIVIFIFLFVIIDAEGYRLLHQLKKNSILKISTDEKLLHNNNINNEDNNNILILKKWNNLLVPAAIILSNVFFPLDIHTANAIGGINLPVLSPTIDVNWRYFLSGAICCSFSHGISVPFDVVKTRIQVSSSTEKKNFLAMTKEIVSVDGWSMLFRGMGPTLFGFAIQGSLKYGLYDTFKQIVKLEFASYGIVLDQIFVFMIAGLLAELIASTFLTPFEAVRIRLVSSPGFDSKFSSIVSDMYSEGGLQSFFLGLPAILLRGVPYTVVQLSSFEVLTSSAYSFLAQTGLAREEALQYQFLITFTMALVSAVLSCLVSQPGDTLLSFVNKSDRGGVKGGDVLLVMRDAVGSVGMKGLFAGTKARLYHVSFFVTVQLLVYDFVKQLCGIPVTGVH